MVDKENEIIRTPALGWNRIFGTPYITVSAKGIANGLSTIPNDGADFGPDSLQADGSPTKTSGIQEARDYAVKLADQSQFSNPTVKISIMLQAGQVFYITKTVNITPSQKGISYGSNFISLGREGATLYQDASTPFPFFTVADDFDADIQLKGISFSQATGFTEIAPALYQTQTSGTTTANYQFNECYFHIWNGSTYIYKGYHIQVGAVEQLIIDKCFGHLIYTANVSAILAVSKAELTTGGVVSPLTDGVMASYNQCSFHTPASGGRYIGVNPTDDSDYQHTMLVSVRDSDVEGTSAENLIYSELNESLLSVVIVGITSRYSSSGLVEITLTHATVGEIYKAHIKGISGTPAYFSGFSLFAPSISANPPVSGTVYQNPDLYDIEIYLPVYATTAGTAGTVAYGISATSTVTEMTPKYVSGATSSSMADIVYLRVPEGWYYEFTGSGVTFGTAVVNAV